MVARRQQTPIHIRSNRAAQLLAQHTRSGRSQAKVIEEALERLPLSEDVPLTPEQREHLAKIDEIVRSVPSGAVMSVTEFDALEYDTSGNPR